MDNQADKVRIVILKKPYDTYRESQFTRDLLSKIFQLKLTGYQQHYPYGILPISDIDFIADHIVICLESENKELTPISGFKSVRNSVCKQFNLPFPIVAHKYGREVEKFSDYVSGIHAWMNDLELKKSEFAYNASWTIQPNLDKSVRNLVRELTYSLVCLYYTTEKIDYMINSTAALHAVNINEERMGMHYLKDSAGNKLSSFKSPTFFDQPFFIMHTIEGGFSAEFLEYSQKFKQLWDDRLVIGEKVQDEKIAA